MRDRSIFEGLLVKRRSWNELKTEVLSLLKDNPGTTSKDISAALEVSMSNAGMILHRFARARAKREELVVERSRREDDSPILSFHLQNMTGR